MAQQDTTVARSAPLPDAASRRRVIASSIIGSALEWYDYYLYAQAAALVFNVLFFTALDPLTGTLAAFGSYAIGFIVRPVGGIVFGRLGDRLGRKQVLVITLVMMGISTALIGLLPTYALAGALAPVLLTLCRIGQGLAAGAEFGGAVVLSAEFAPKGRRGIYAAAPAIGVSLGILLASGVFAIFSSLPEEQFLSWGWRIPFLLSIVIIGVALFIRLRVQESPVFKELEEAGETSRSPIRDVFKYARKPFFIAFGARMGENSTAYIFQTWILTYIVTVGMDRGIGLQAVVIATAAGLVTIPFWGWLSDRVGRKVIYMAGAGGMAAFTFPFFGLVDTGDPVLIVLALAFLLAVLYQAMFATQGSLLSDLFPAKYRFTGIALARETSAVVAGGIAPFVATALLAASGNAYWPIAIYAILMCVISFVSLLAYREATERHTEHE
ncbi:metabolite-proton symporter [Georgenia soli]|uniref:Metabolite-proton symporter n=1 Tax=Georgenia soli TaxID=638953 RepID=A0A2A9F2A0_9MICO|nr:MFS transporter [Georgenia soli]PFG45123.1 metabolite-proton symporter [Georgenia soli]